MDPQDYSDLRSPSIDYIRFKSNIHRYSHRHIRVGSRLSYSSLVATPSKTTPRKKINKTINYDNCDDHIGCIPGDREKSINPSLRTIINGPAARATMKREIYNFCWEANKATLACGRTCHVCYWYCIPVARRRREAWRRIPEELGEVNEGFMRGIEWEDSREYEEDYLRHLEEKGERELPEGEWPERDWGALVDKEADRKEREEIAGEWDFVDRVSDSSSSLSWEALSYS